MIKILSSGHYWYLIDTISDLRAVVKQKDARIRKLENDIACLKNINSRCNIDFPNTNKIKKGGNANERFF